MAKVEYATRRDIEEIRKEINLIKKVIAEKIFEEISISEEEIKRIRKLLDEAKKEEFIDIEEV